VTGQRGTLSIRALEAQQLLPEELTYQSKLRAAMSGVVGESDVTEVVKEIVAKAKTGDRHAQKMFLSTSSA
jgi:nitrogen regulatory protein PII